MERCLTGEDPVVAASDWVRALPRLIGSYLRAPFVVLGTDGFGRSDTRQALREFFEVDRHQIVLAALHALARAGRAPADAAVRAIRLYRISRPAKAPWEH